METNDINRSESIHRKDRIDEQVSDSDTSGNEEKSLILREKDIFRLVIESSPVAMLVVSKKGRISFINSQTEQYFGYKRDELMGQSIDILIPQNSRDTHSKHVVDFFNKTQTRPMGAGRDLHGLHRDGSVFPVEIGLNTIEMGGEAQVLVSIVDITKRKKAEDELQKSNQQLEEVNAKLKSTQHQVIQQERLQALGEMIRGITHDFNNALMPIICYSEMILNRPEIIDNREKLLNYLKEINETAQEVANVISRLNEFYNIKEIKREFKEIDLNHLVEQTVSLAKHIWEGGDLAKGKTIKVEKD
jgi:PAS domain S-box-containing protein